MKQYSSLIFALLLLAFSAAGKNNMQTVDNIIDQQEQVRISNTDSTLRQALLNLKQAKIDNNILQQVELEFTIGYAYYNRNNYDSSLQHLNNSLNLARQNNMQDWVAINLNRIGNVFQLKSNYSQALESYSQAAEINRKNNNKQQLASVLVNMGSVYTLTGDNTKAIELILEALTTFESISNQNGIAWTSLSISRLFNRIGINEKALLYADQALNEYKSLNDQIGITLSMTELANIYYRNNLFSRALPIAQQVLKINNSNNNKHGKAANHLLIGIIYYKMDSIQLALHNLNIAKDIKQTLSDSIDLSKLNLYLGNVYEAMGMHQTAIGFFNKSTQIAQKQGLANELGDIYYSLSSIYKKLGKHKIALDYYQKYSTIKDSINANDISQLEMQYNFEKREYEKELINLQKEEIQKARIKRQQIYSIFISIALILTILLAALIFYHLKEKQKTNKLLLERNTEISQQKNEIEAQRDFVKAQRDQIEMQKRQITDSITYASRIQKAILPLHDSLKSYLQQHFIFYRPKNIVSGDFYWIAPITDGRLAIVVADCTGHGVPGAFMSMLGITLLKELPPCINDSAGDILFKLRRIVISVLHQNGDEGRSQDGMDMALLLVDSTKHEVQFAGAYLPVIVVRHADLPVIECANNSYKNEKNVLFEIRGDKMPIGYHVIGERPFTTKTFSYHSSDSFYLFSDGYTDQFGGPNNSKYMLTNLKEQLLNIQNLQLNEQCAHIIETHEAYKGNNPQLDDILVFGFKLP